MIPYRLCFGNFPGAVHPLNSLLYVIIDLSGRDFIVTKCVIVLHPYHSLITTENPIQHVYDPKWFGTQKHAKPLLT